VHTRTRIALDAALTLEPTEQALTLALTLALT
jgi:hypothetical protein